ncbi:MAG: ATP-binding protein [Patescibacteria group bacterium]
MESFRLIAHNIIFLSGGVLNVILAIFVWIKMNRNIKPIAITFTLFMLSVAMFQISHALGIMADDAETSRLIFMFNLANIPIGIFWLHWFLYQSERTKTRLNRFIIPFFYVTGAAMLAFFIIYPDTFLLPSVSKLYFPFYYNPGEYQIVMRIWFNTIGLYCLYELFRAYRETDDHIKKNRYKYVLFSLIYAFILGSTAILLVFNIPFDPFYSAFFGLFTLPLVYVMIKYELLDIRVIAKQATLYSFFVTLLFLVMTILVTLNDYIIRSNPLIPQWLLPLLVSVVMVAVGLIIWKQIRKTDILKYQFINIISHKFRTPLTYIKWETDSIIKDETISETLKERVVSISERNEHLIELTNTLVTLAESEDFGRVVSKETFSIRSLVDDIVKKFSDRIARQKIYLDLSLGDNISNIFAEKNKIEFVIHSLFDNALSYTPAGGAIRVGIRRSFKSIEVEIKDSGIGFEPSERSFIFSKFYRSPKAQAADTEGMGINLFMCQQIIESNGGRIQASSEGVGKGSVFSFTLPIPNK